MCQALGGQVNNTWAYLFLVHSLCVHLNPGHIGPSRPTMALGSACVVLLGIETHRIWTVQILEV